MAYNSPGKQVAFDLIKPVLEKANAEQLKSIEYYSPVNLFYNHESFQKINIF